jgi:tRNA threonylcarbamoyladenosine biosynthesis protein TsaE
VIANKSTESFTTSSPEETEAVAAKLAQSLSAGDVVLLTGELGAGKTTFVRGAAKALGVSANVTSPTFAIGNVYDGARLEVAHVDLYRLGQISIDDEAVLDDFLTPARVAFVEWPHAELGERSDLRARIELSHAGGDARSIEIAWLANEGNR